MAEVAQTLTENLYSLHAGVHGDCLRCLGDAITREQLNLQQLHLLLWMRKTRSRPTVSQAARVMGITSGAASRSIAILAGRHLVLREPDSRDERSKRLELTEQGRDLAARLDLTRLHAVGDYAERLTPLQQRKLQEALEAIFTPPQPPAPPPPTPAERFAGLRTAA